MENFFDFISRQKMALLQGRVIAVEAEHCHVVLEDKGEDVWECTYNSLLENENDKLVLYPKLGSMVTIGFINRESAVIVSVSDVEKVYFKQGKSEMIFDQGGFEFNRDGENLKKVLNEFQTNFGKLCDELAKVVVSVGVTPDVPAIQAIKQAVVQTNKTALNKILK